MHLEPGLGVLELVRGDQIWDILHEELPGFVTDQIVGVKVESK